MKYLLDTNICIYIIKQHTMTVVMRLKNIPAHHIAISSITLSELEYGVAKSQLIQKNEKALKKFIQSFDVIPFDQTAATYYGKLRTQLEKSGKPIGPLDILIAAHAISLGSILVTNNGKEFNRVEGLAIENWAQ